MTKGRLASGATRPLHARVVGGLERSARSRGMERSDGSRWFYQHPLRGVGDYRRRAAAIRRLLLGLAGAVPHFGQ